ncbi:MAG: hypothetical protein HY205_04700 [Nitrospirae bacterium]|nr:hypothetical protein [Nitrospirota bacterium]
MTKIGYNVMTYGLLLLALTWAAASCSKKAESSKAAPPAPPAASAPGAQTSEASPTQAAPATQPDGSLTTTGLSAPPAAQAPSAASAPGPQALGTASPQTASAPQSDAAAANTNPTDPYVISTDPELTGRLGRLVVTFPDGANASGSPVDVYKPGEAKAVAGGYGSQQLDLLPGTYAVVISGKRIEGVIVQSAHDTKMKVGVLRVSAGSGTRIDLVDSITQKEITGGYGKQVFGLPIGTVQVRIAGQSELVTIQDGKITDF